MENMTRNETSDQNMNAIKDACIFWFEGILVPIIGSIGIFGNILGILVLKKKNLDLKPGFRNLLITLFTYDMLFVIGIILFYTISIHSDWYHKYLIPYMLPFLFPFVQTALTGSVYSVVAIALERYLLICKYWQESVNGLRWIVSIFIISIVYNINKCFEVTYEHVTREYEVHDEYSNLTHKYNETRPVIRVTSLRKNATYTQTSIIINFVVMIVLPLCTLITCHILTYKVIKRLNRTHNFMSKNQRRDNAMATLFFIIIICFITCHVFKIILNFFEVYQILTGTHSQKFPLWAFVLTRVNHFMLVLNSSVNFYIYSFRDAKFRNATMETLRLKIYTDLPSSTGEETAL